jgi:hypothetical protein
MASRFCNPIGRPPGQWQAAVNGAPADSDPKTGSADYPPHRHFKLGRNTIPFLPGSRSPEVFESRNDLIRRGAPLSDLLVHELREHSDRERLETPSLFPSDPIINVSPQNSHATACRKFAALTIARRAGFDRERQKSFETWEQGRIADV